MWVCLCVCVGRWLLKPPGCRCGWALIPRSCPVPSYSVGLINTLSCPVEFFRISILPRPVPWKFFRSRDIPLLYGISRQVILRDLVGDPIWFWRNKVSSRWTKVAAYKMVLLAVRVLMAGSSIFSTPTAAIPKAVKAVFLLCHADRESVPPVAVCLSKFEAYQARKEGQPTCCGRWVRDRR